MPYVAIVTGILLGLVGIGGYIATGMHHLTALIPFFLGDVLVGCGIVTLAQPNWRKHAMHVAATVALIGFLGTAMSVVKIAHWIAGSAPERPAAVAAQGATAILCLVFMACAIRSFRAARRARKLQSS